MAEILIRHASLADAPRLAAIEKELAAAAGDLKNPGPSFGYHSAIAPTQGVTKWVQVDLGDRHDIREVTLRPCHDTFNGIGAGFGFPPRYRVEVADDPTFTTGVTTVASREEADASNPGIEPQVFTAGGLVECAPNVHILRNPDVFTIGGHAVALSSADVLLPMGTQAYVRDDDPWSLIDVSDLVSDAANAIARSADALADAARAISRAADSISQRD